MDIRFDDKGLVVAIAQDADSGEVLMQAYMNKEALEKTISTGYATYYSRSRGRLWVKGEESGHTQKLVKIYYDCDSDSILLKVIQEGVACHTGNRSCFFRELVSMPDYPDYNIVKDIARVIADRKLNPKEGSYTNYLLDKGLDKILKKIGEEAAEVIIASKNKEKNDIIMEISDLIYHTLILMDVKDISFKDIYNELMMREGKTPDPKYLAKK